MNAERLLQHYEKIADAPDAIARLRRFILDLAVRGKLVPQDSGDEPAFNLAARVQGTRQNKRKFAQINHEELEKPLPRLPENWVWTTVDHASADDENAITDGPFGSQLKTEHYVPTPGYRVIRLQNIGSGSFREVHRSYVEQQRYDRLTKHHVKAGDLVVAGLVDPEVRCCIVPDDIGPALVKADCYRFSVHPEFSTYFALHFLNSPLAQELASVHHHGMTLTRIGLGNFRRIPFPLPPLAEQHRIVAKVDELMALCDELETARTEREAKRDRLAAASLASLNTPDPETFRDDARFALDALPALTARPDQIKQLRQTILNLAVRGKLVPQDPADESAEVLLKRIAEEKTRVAKQEKVKRQDTLPEIDLDQAPFELPSGWTWGRFPEIGTFGRGKSKHRPRNDPALFVGGKHLMIQTGDVARSRGIIETYTSKYNDFGLSQSFKWPKGTLCITIAANIADSGILSFAACFPDSVVGFIPVSVFDNARYFEYFVRTAKANLLEFAPATAQKNINLEILTQVLIPLPPLAEQHRIVAKVDELMALCDQLEASLTTADETRRTLLDALLAEALAPIESEVKEAAE